MRPLLILDLHVNKCIAAERLTSPAAAAPLPTAVRGWAIHKSASEIYAIILLTARGEKNGQMYANTTRIAQINPNGKPNSAIAPQAKKIAAIHRLNN
jgi:hypothetical protein